MTSATKMCSYRISNLYAFVNKGKSTQVIFTLLLYVSQSTMILSSFYVGGNNKTFLRLHSTRTWKVSTRFRRGLQY